MMFGEFRNRELLLIFRVSLRLWVLGVVLRLYVLSTGPVLKWSNARGGRNNVIFIYYPLIVLGHHVPAADRFLGWYVNELWKAYK